ncbi:PREDICTED: mannose-6-phosphate isomerase [Nicrophorus vespilloides]|uniref:mannose-6-phosphate isomerase n=1 Tax=Nicrophorus vespilloides TaxID=110193 RepID=A0ABM1N233_NICVS|nr:PREDICTED: mannose-6-phosphate isomerase [Nicrophorus vespilloides]
MDDFLVGNEEIIKLNLELKIYKYQDGVMELEPSVKNYEWGNRGSRSVIARMLYGEYAVLKEDVNENEDERVKPFAELWMGTHPSGPSTIKYTDEPLSHYIDNNPDCLGQESVELFGQRLPFLFKILSIRKALSVQAHPNKEFAQELHAKFPDIYKDDNHKPELAIALTPFKAMCGFRPLHEIRKFIKDVPELRTVIGAANADKLINSTTKSDGMDALKTCFRSLMTCNPDDVSSQLHVLLDTYKKQCKKKDELLDLILSLALDFPGDVGCFSPYFLNVISLKPGQAIFLGPNIPHAYISGDCIECMSSSDNVVRAGLTPKFKDVETLCSMLDYDGKPAEEHFLPPIEVSDVLHIYKPPVADFLVEKFTITEVSAYLIPAVAVASILLCVDGSAETSDGPSLHTGNVVFVSAGRELQLKPYCQSGCRFFRAMVNLHHPLHP